MKNLYRLNCRCPKCRRHPALRVTADEVRDKLRRHAEYLVGTLQCAHCATIFELRAGAYHSARPDALYRQVS